MAGDKDDKKKDKGEAKPKKDKADKPDKGEKQAKGEGGDKSAKAEGKGKGGGEKKGEGKGKAAKSTAPEGGYKRTAPPRLKAFYAKEVVPNLMKDFKYVNQMQVPRLQKISVNIGLGEAAGNPKLLDTAVEEMRAITGQHPVVTKAKKAIANFKLREGQKIGVMVTLRREKMWELLAGHSRADHLPGDQLRQDRQDQRFQRVDRDLGEDRRGGACSPPLPGDAVPAVRGHHGPFGSGDSA